MANMISSLSFGKTIVIIKGQHLRYGEQIIGLAELTKNVPN